MKTVSLYPHCFEAARDRQDLGHARHSAVKCRVKAGHLRQFRMTPAKRLDQFNLARQMIRVVGTDAMQFIQQFLCDTLGLGVFHAVDHSVFHCLEGSETNSLFEPADQDICCRPVIGGLMPRLSC